MSDQRASGEEWPAVMWAGRCPQALEVCCWCGATRTTPIGFGESAGVHGAFRPDHTFVLLLPGVAQAIEAEQVEQGEVPAET